MYPLNTSQAKYPKPTYYSYDDDDSEFVKNRHSGKDEDGVGDEPRKKEGHLSYSTFPGDERDSGSKTTLAKPVHFATTSFTTSFPIPMNIDKVAFPLISSNTLAINNANTHFSLPISTSVLASLAPAGTTIYASPILSQQNKPLGPPRHLSVALITLLAIGCAFFVLGIFLILKACCQPARRSYPTPSLPISDHTFLEDGMLASDSSPLFGGKERHGSQEPLMWAQYVPPTAPICKPEQAAGATDAWGSNDLPPGSKSPNLATRKALSASQPQFHYPFARQGTGFVSAVTPANSLRELAPPSALSRVISRISSVTGSVYPDTPVPCETEIGVAVGQRLSLTGDGHQVMTRTKASVRRSRDNVLADEEEIKRLSAGTRYSNGFAYDGADVSSPSLFEAVPTINIVPSSSTSASASGRIRVRSEYFAGSRPPRKSAVQRVSPLCDANSEDGQSSFESACGLPMHAGDKDTTAALCDALGLGSPFLDQQSERPQTIYPDDSLSVVFGHSQPVHRAKPLALKSALKPTNRAGPKLPTMDVGGDGGKLGNLMLADAGTATTTNRSVFGPGVGRRARVADGPPRVPSPPPLPSLAQMALEHSNLQAYQDYKSPTYSIYGLYSTRKSGEGF